MFYKTFSPATPDIVKLYLIVIIINKACWTFRNNFLLYYKLITLLKDNLIKYIVDECAIGYEVLPPTTFPAQPVLTLSRLLLLTSRLLAVFPLESFSIIVCSVFSCITWLPEWPHCLSLCIKFPVFKSNKYKSVVGSVKDDKYNKLYVIHNKLLYLSSIVVCTLYIGCFVIGV